MQTLAEIRHNYPQYSDMSDKDLANSLHKKYYSDIPIDEYYSKIGLTQKETQQPENQSELLRYGIKDPLAGILNFGSKGGTSAGNLAIGLINKLGGNLPKQEATDFSEMLGIPEEQKNLADKLIQFAPEIGISLALPETRLGKVGELLDMLPAWGKYLKTGLGNAISQGALAASQSPEDQGTAAIEAGSIAAPFSAISKGVLSGSPTVRNLSRAAGALGGAGLGYLGSKSLGANEPVADITAALMGIAGSGGLNTQRRVRENMLKGVEGTPYQEARDAAQGLGLSYITPAEASGNPFTGGVQGNIGKTERGAQLLYQRGKERATSEKNAIENLYENISKSPEIASASIRDSAQKEIERLKQERLNASEPHYKQAHDKKVAMTWVTNLENSDATIKNAIRDAMTDPKYQTEGELKGLPKNSIKVLDYAKRKIDAQIEQAKNFGDQDAARVLNKSKNRLLDKLATIDKDYAKGREVYSEYSKPIEKLEASQVGRIANTKDTQLKNISSSIFDPAQTDLSVLRQIKDTVQKHNPEAWNGIVRNEMERLMGKKKDMTGSNFYNQILANENKFNQFKTALSDNKKASEKLDDMKKIFGRLINVPTAKTAEALSRTSMSKERSSTQTAMRYLQELLSGGKYDKAAVELITSPKWTDELDKLGRITNTDKLIGAFHNLMGKAGAQAIAQ